MKLLKPIAIIVICVSILPGRIYSQRGNNWCFGYHAGLNFNTSPPTQFTNRCAYKDGDTNRLNSSTTSSSISDCSGNLLFYVSDWNVYNRDNQIMVNGQLGYSRNSIIVPFPGDTSKYYLFTQGLYYSIVDMTLDSGKGGLILGSNNVQINKSPGPFAIVKQQNGRDYWLISVTWTDSIYVYPVTAKGIGKPKKQLNLYLGPLYYYGYIRTDHKGDKLLVTNLYYNKFNESAVLFSFDQVNGLVSKYPQDVFDSSYNNTGAVMGEFSPNDSLFYITIYQNDKGYHSTIIQYSTYSSNIQSSALTILTERDPMGQYGPLGTLRDIRLAADNKIYLTDYPSSGVPYYLDVIQHPDIKGAACVFKPHYINLYPHTAVYLPNVYYPDSKLKWHYNNGCQDTVVFTNFSDTNYYKSFKWYFGDGDSSDKISPKHIYKNNGNYKIALTGINECGTTSYLSDSIRYRKSAKASFSIDSIKRSCLSAKVILHNNYPDSGQSYLYDYGDQSPQTHLLSHFYSKAGKYIITQSVSNGACQDTIKDSVTIEAMPVSGFIPTLSAGCSPLESIFSNTSSNAFFYKWLYDDGTSDTAKNPSHVFTLPGYHQVDLLAYNHEGCVDTFSLKNAVYVSHKPVPSFTTTQTYTCKGMQVSFNNTSGFADHYEWDFITNSTDSASNPSFIFKKDSIYPVKLIAKNKYCSDSLIQNVKISIPGPVAHYTILSNSICVGKQIEFSNNSIRAKSYVWQFGDGTMDTIVNATHAYKNYGYYSVKLIAIDSIHCTDTFTIKNAVRIDAWARAIFSVKDSTASCGMKRYTFNDSTFGTYSNWNFGDGTAVVKKKAGDPPVIYHDFTQSAVNSIKVTTNYAGCLDSSVKQLRVIVRPKPIASFVADSVVVCLGHDIIFRNLTQDADEFYWKFGDFDHDTDTNPVHRYRDPGKFDVSLEATTYLGCISQTTRTAYITVADTFTARISPKNIQSCAPVTVQFKTPTTTKDIPLNYLWSFGDAQNSKLQNPTHIFQSNGGVPYHIKLLVSNLGCRDSAYSTVKVLSLDPFLDTIKMKLASVENNDSVIIKWQKNTLAVRYRLLRSVDGLNYFPVANTKDTVYIDKNVDVNDTNYYYKVAGLDICDGYTSPGKEAETILLKAQRQDNNESCNLSWNSYNSFLTGLKNYEVYRDQQILSPVFSASYSDIDFFNASVSGRQYQVFAYENSKAGQISASNIVTVPFQSKMWVPNAFTPDNNGINDSFKVICSGIKYYYIQVYNRWGELVFESFDTGAAWHNDKNKKILPGVYMYYIKASAMDGSPIFQKGTISVL